MTTQRLYIVHGMGNDSVGLVGKITAPIAEAGGNIIDMRQDVLHGLFTLFMIVDLSDCELRIDALREIVSHISEDTGLALSVENYLHAAVKLEKSNMLLVILGHDKPGIIASVSEMLGRYEINIELSQTIAREGIFLMELLTDISRCTIPMENLKAVLGKKMAEMDMTVFFQLQDVFNKKKRLLVFDIETSLIRKEQLKEIVELTSLTMDDIANAYSREKPVESLTTAASLLDGFPVEVLTMILEGLKPSAGTTELFKTLKIMGYKIVLLSNGFSLFTDALQQQLGITGCYGIEMTMDDDSRTIIGRINPDRNQEHRRKRIIQVTLERNEIAADDVTVLSDIDSGDIPGICLELDLGKILDLFNTHAISKENMLGLLGYFGIPCLV